MLPRTGLVLAVAIAGCASTESSVKAESTSSTTTPMESSGPSGSATSPTATTESSAAPSTTREPPTSKTVVERDYARVLVGKNFEDGAAFVRLERRSDGDVIAWSAGCNGIGGSVIVGETTLDVGDDLSQSATGCSPEAAKADDALTAFMTSDPHWLMTLDRLTLESGSETRTFIESTSARP